MKKIQDLFSCEDKTISFEIRTDRPSLIENIYEDFKQYFNIQPENVISDKGWVITLSHPDYEFNINATLEFSPFDPPKDPKKINFRLVRFSKKSAFNFEIQSLEELFALDEGDHSLGIGYDQLSDDQDTPDLMREFLKSLDLAHLFEGNDGATITHPETQKKMRIYITHFNACDTYALHIQHMDSEEK